MNLRQIRESRNMSQIELAKKLAVGQSTVSMWETGDSKPTFENLLKLCQILSCSLDELIKIDLNQHTA
jgi:transcriptional regulator with XRE-family HTH domain